MNHLTIAICEDNTAEYQELLSICQCSGIDCVCERFEEGAAFLARFYPGKYDLILMDIYMNGLDGVETVSRLRELDSGVPVAFITTSLDHAMDGYRLRVSRYLRKPLQEKEVIETLSFALREKRTLPGFAFSTRQETRNIPFREIRDLEQANHDVHIFLTGGRVLRLRERLDHLEAQFPVPPFFRSHKSFLINLTQVRCLDRERNVFEMNEGGTVYIRRASVSEAFKALERVLFDETRNL